MPDLLAKNFLLAFFSFALLCPGKAQEADTLLPLGIFDLLNTDDISKISVSSNLSYIIENKRTSDEYIQGDFIFNPSKGVTQTLPVKIKCRGKYRRVKCDFPPLKLKFKKDDLAAHNLNEFNELKLVTHCMDIKDEKYESRDLILREHLTYRLYNILTPNSFRTKLVAVNYLNTEGKPKKIKGWGILIEDEDELAHRMKGEKYEQFAIPYENFNSEHEKITALFNYMIGNTDWSLLLSRNVQYIKYSEKDIVIVPYDFDFAGMVEAPYAVPNVDLGQKSIKDRIYMGCPANAIDLADTFQHFKNKKESLFKEIKEFKFLASASKKVIREYLEEFYQIIENEELAQKVMFPVPAAED